MPPRTIQKYRKRAVSQRGLNRFDVRTLLLPSIRASRDNEEEEMLDEWPQTCYVGPKVPISIDIPCENSRDSSLPGWMIGRRRLYDSKKSIEVYISPEGVLYESRDQALAATNQLRLSHSEERMRREELQRRAAEEEALEQPFALRDKARELQTDAHARWTSSESGHIGAWEPGEYIRHIDSLFSKQAIREKMDQIDQNGKNCAAPCERVAVIDLFAGGGGLSLGFRAAGFGAIFGVDSHESCIDTYRTNLCGSRSLQQTIRFEDLDKWESAAREAGLAGENRTVDLVLIGGPPCQPFTNMGTRGGVADNRDGFSTFIEMAIRLQPIVVVLENVPQLLTPEYDEGVQPLLRRLKDYGYAIHAGLYKCENYGVPQRRRRVILTCVHERLYKSKVKVDVKTVEPVPLVADVVGTPEFWAQPDAPVGRSVELRTLERRARAGRFTSTTGIVCPVRTAPTLLTSSLNDASYMRLMAAPASVLPNNLLARHMRKILLDDVKLIQSFPSDFEFRGGISAQKVQVANAVPPRFAYALGCAVAELLAKSEVYPTASVDPKLALRTFKVKLSDKLAI